MTSDDPAIHFLGRTLSRTRVDGDAIAVAGLLAHHGVRPGDRVLLVLQNMPQAVIACQAIWRLGAIVVPVNPMYKTRELSGIVADCRPSAAIVLDELYADVVQPALAAYGDAVPVFTTSALDYADPLVASELGLHRASGIEDSDLVRALEPHLPDVLTAFKRDSRPPNEIGALVYTSGTTGPPKGAMIRHRHLTAEVSFWREVYDLRRGDAIMAVAPFFHITGLVADLVVGLDTATTLVQSYRFDPISAVRWIERYRPTCIVAAITVYTALLNQPTLTEATVESFRTCLSGGAPVAAATVERWRERTGVYIRNCYGLTETNSLTTIAPLGIPAPVDPTSGALSVGKAVGPTSVRIVDDRGLGLPPGALGEVVISGPQVIDGYWEKPEETAKAIRDDGLHTGDIGILDEQGWLYLVDRSKDLIVASGYKVWPREVEDVLLEHPSVVEAGVIGVADAYRGEQVVAFVALRAGCTTDDGELVDFCRSRLAVFKAPRRITILPELPKTASGKILRRELRDLDPIAPEARSTSIPASQS